MLPPPTRTAVWAGCADGELFALEQRGECSGACALGQCLLAFQQYEDGGGDLVLSTVTISST